MQFVQNVTKFGTQATPTTMAFGSSVGKGRGIIVSVSSQQPLNSITDSQGNVYTRVAHAPLVGYQSAIWYANTSAAGALTLTLNFRVAGLIAAYAAEINGPVVPVEPLIAFGNSVGPTGIIWNPQPYEVVGLWADSVIIAGTNPLGVGDHNPGWAHSTWWELDPVWFGEGTNGLFAPGEGNTGLGSRIDPSQRFSDSVARPWSAAGSLFREGLIAEFSGTPTSGAAPLSVAFTDESTGNPALWRWVFGDGNESTSQNPTHNYATAETYTVTLFISRGLDATFKTRTNYITVGAGGGGNGPPVQPPSISQQATSPSTILAAYGLGFAAAFSSPIQPTFPPPPPDQTALEVEQEILNLNLLREMVQAIATEQGSSDPVRLSEAVRQMTRVVDGLLYVNQLQMTGDGEYELITGGWSDADEPTGNDLAGDGEVWIEWPSVYRSRRDRMPPDTEDESDPTLWVCVLDDDGTPQWFEVEIYPEGRTTSGATGTF